MTTGNRGAPADDGTAGRPSARRPGLSRRAALTAGAASLAGVSGLVAAVWADEPAQVGATDRALRLQARDDRGTLTWVGSDAAWARAVGWAVVTDALWAGGAVGDGDADDTRAVRAAAASGRTVFFPAGAYRGSFDLDLPAPRLVGAGRHDVRILVADGHFLVDSDQSWSSTRVEHLTVAGGLGALRNRYTGTNVTQQHVVTDCDFVDYTGAAISTESADMPLWRVLRCTFRAADHTASIGVAFNGLTDVNAIQNCEFQSNSVHVKLAEGGNNAHLTHNDFLQYRTPEKGLRRAMVWVVPAREATNSGAGLVIADNKFGNENLGIGDLRIGYADEGAGEFTGERLPRWDADSEGFVTGHLLRGGLVSGGTSNPIIYSTTPRVRGCAVTGVVLAGTLPSMVLQLRSPTTRLDSEAYSNLAGPFLVVDRGFSPFPVSNQPGLFHLDDPNQTLDVDPSTPMAHQGGGSATGFVRLTTQRLLDTEVEGDVARTVVTDALDGQDAAVVTLPEGGSVLFPAPPGAVQGDYPVWIEFDLRRAASDPLDELTVTWGLDDASSGGAGQYLRRRVRPTATWRPHRLLTVAPEATDGFVLRLFRAPEATGTRVDLGRVRVYHAREPVPATLSAPDAVTTSRAPAAGGAEPLPATPSGYLTIHVDGVPRQLAFW